MLGVRGLRKSYGDTVALAGVDLDVAPGEIVGLLGPNGAGKTTMVSIVAGLRRADGGSVTVNGIDALAKPAEARRCIGLAPQELGIYPLLTVRDNLLVFAELADLRGRTRDQRIDEIAEALELTEFMDRPARHLSGGEKRRLHTALALVHRPPLLLLDEPTTGVDVRTRARVLDVVRGLAEAGSAVCYSTHYLPEVEALGASVAIIDRGQVLVRGPIEELVRRHGECAVELTFDGAPPQLALELRSEARDQMLRIYTDEPATVAASVLTRLGADAERLRSIDLVYPSLEAVFLAVTGRRYAEGSAEEEVERVPSS